MADFIVTNTNDSGAGSLREAISDANAASGADRIVFDALLAGETIRLTGGQIVIFDETTIDGDLNGDRKADITISGNDASRIFKISGDVTLRSLTLAHGAAEGGGGAVQAGPGSVLTVIDTTLRGNAVTDYGGAIYAEGTLNLLNSTVSGNQAGLNGGGIVIGGTATITGSTFSGNSAEIGGGIQLIGGATATLEHSTVTGNSATDSDSGGGGIHLFDNSGLEVRNSVIAGNAASSGAHEDVGETGGTFQAMNSFFGVDTLSDLGAIGNQDEGGDPGLGALADNGGPVMTHALLADSPLIAAGEAGFLNSMLPADIYDLDGDGNVSEKLPTDANGGARLVGRLDIGAVESQTTPLVVSTGSDSGADATTGINLAADAEDGGGLSLREAAHWAGDGDTISFAAALDGATITLGNGQIELDHSIAINGDIDSDRKADIAISGDDVSRIFSISTDADVTLRSLTLKKGYSSGFGGAIYADDDSVLSLIDSTISDSNSADSAGAILAGGALNLVNSTISNNQAEERGGGVFAEGMVNIVNSTLSGNGATYGGGLYASSGTQIALDSSTITGNTASDTGGGVNLAGSSQLTVRNSVIAGNVAGSGADIGEIEANSTIAAASSFFGTSVSIDTDGSGNLNGGGDPLLGALADNGGPVMTHAQLPGSKLIGAGDATLLPDDIFDLDGDDDVSEKLPVDARGGARVTGTLDIGAVEMPAPVITADDQLVIENTLAVMVASATHAFDYPVRYSLSGGADAGGFTIDETTGALRFKVAPDYEAPGDANGDNNYAVTVRASAGDDLFDEQTIAITVANANDAPVITSNGGGAAATVLIQENATAVTAVIAADPDAGDMVSYALSGADADKFSISAAGVLAFRAGPDFDAPGDADGNNSYVVTVVAADGADAADTQVLTINVTNVNEAPVIVSGGGGGTANVSVKENGTAVMTVAVSDPDAGDTVSYSLAGADAGKFSISDAGVLAFKTAPDFEAPGDANGDNFYLLTVAAEDESGLFDTQELRVRVTDVGTAGTAGDNTLKGTAGKDEIKGLGGNDTLSGGKNKDVLDGGKGKDLLDGGGDSDKLLGGKGDDILNGGKGKDLLDGGKDGDKLDGGKGDDSLNGGKGKDVLDGGKGNDKLDGGGGKDTMDGGGGKDTADYSGHTKRVVVKIDGSHEVTVKIGGKGEDKISNFEHVTGGGKNDKLIGDGKANSLHGEAGDDYLDGGAGRDTLGGGSGKDQFVFSTKPGKSNVDTISDFNRKHDQIVLDDAIFNAIGAKLDKGEFYAKAGATEGHDGNDRIIYDKSNGNLYYDDDGKGGDTAMHFATLTGHPSLSHHDFIIA